MRTYDAHCAYRKQKRDYYLYQSEKVRLLRKELPESSVLPTRLTYRDRYQSAITAADLMAAEVRNLMQLVLTLMFLKPGIAFLLPFYPTKAPQSHKGILFTSQHIEAQFIFIFADIKELCNYLASAHYYQPVWKRFIISPRSLTNNFNHLENAL